jgi:hypothetical protein
MQSTQRPIDWRSQTQIPLPVAPMQWGKPSQTLVRQDDAEFVREPTIVCSNCGCVWVILPVSPDLGRLNGVAQR